GASKSFTRIGAFCCTKTAAFIVLSSVSALGKILDRRTGTGGAHLRGRSPPGGRKSQNGPGDVKEKRITGPRTTHVPVTRARCGSDGYGVSIAPRDRLDARRGGR